MDHDAVQFLVEARDRRLADIAEFCASPADFQRAHETADSEFYLAMRQLAAVRGEAR